VSRFNRPIAPIHQQRSDSDNLMLNSDLVHHTMGFSIDLKHLDSKNHSFIFILLTFAAKLAIY
jgi:hypothetical protein